MRGTRVPAAALRLLRYALPVCLVAASIVAAMGLFRVVGRPATEPLSQQAPSLHLGASPGAASPPVALPTPTPTPTPSPTPRPRPLAPLTAPVAVFNASGVSGLAGRTAAALRLRGVNVASIGNLSQALRPAGTAVYYPPGIRSQAQTLAKLSGATTVSPAPEWLAAAGTLVLVLTDSESALAAATTTLARHVP
jgi:LytR cell envelope-related transcriptional attenuator